MDNKKFYRYGKHFDVESCIKAAAERNKFNDYYSLAMFVDYKTRSQEDTTITGNKDVFVRYYLPEIAKGVLFSVAMLLFAWIVGGAK